MGCPDIYYKKALQSFAYDLNILSNKEMAEEMLKEQNEEILENEIIRWKNKISEDEFYFDAGRIYASIAEDSYRNDGNDAFNACAGGLYSFCVLIGLEKED